MCASSTFVPLLSERVRRCDQALRREFDDGRHAAGRSTRRLRREVDTVWKEVRIVQMIVDIHDTRNSDLPRSVDHVRRVAVFARDIRADRLYLAIVDGDRSSRTPVALTIRASSMRRSVMNEIVSRTTKTVGDPIITLSLSGVWRLGKRGHAENPFVAAMCCHMGALDEEVDQRYLFVERQYLPWCDTECRHAHHDE